MMQVMGMKRSVIWTAWILMSSVTMLVICAELTLLLKFAEILPYSNPLLIFYALVVFSISVVMYRLDNVFFLIEAMSWTFLLIFDFSKSDNG